jgi:hypothetical protein
MPKKSNNQLLPLTTDDIIGGRPMSQQFDRLSIAGSVNSQSTLPSINSYSQRHQQRSRVKKIRDNLNSRIRIPKYIKRMFVFNSLDFETAFWEMMNLINNPKRVYKALYYQKQTKNKWARDDPSFVLILCFFLFISAIFWGLMYTSGILGILKLILYMVIVDFLFFGLLIATIGWILANKFFLKPDSQISNLNNSSNIFTKYFNFNSILEWSYCFDVHCNAYLIIWLCLYLVQFFFIPLLRMNNIISTIIGNTLYFFSLSYYFLITFYGYNALPFLYRTEYLLVPIIGFIIAWLCLTFTGVNIANIMCTSYFN